MRRCNVMCLNCGRPLKTVVEEPSRSEKAALAMMLRGLDNNLPDYLPEFGVNVTRSCGCGYWRKEMWMNGMILACKERLVLPAVDLR